MTPEDFFAFPWQGVAGFVAVLVGTTVLASKWIPGVRRIVGSFLAWVGSELTASLRDEIRDFRDEFRDHTNDPNAHKGTVSHHDGL